ncbi:quinate/shikimate dehydrogenase, partial [Escherichia coli]|nr:quinate/shikimate dehydrogenase [Escherichia coli]
NAEKTVEKINSKTDCKAQLFDIEDHDQLRKEIAESVIFTNATGVGMKPFEGETLLPSADMLRPELIVSDVVYKPTKTRLLEIA